jgi:hypothetical protein
MLVLMRTHAGLMFVGFLLFLAGFAIVRLMRRKRWWLKAHRALGITGAVIVVCGLFAEALHISLAGMQHLKVPHAYVGIVAVFLALVTPVLGHLQFKFPRSVTLLKRLHVTAGGTLLVLVAINIILGLSIAGII